MERRRRRDGRRRYRSPRVFLNAPTVYICFGSERMSRVDMRRTCTHRGYCINGSASRRARRHVMREVTPWPRRRREWQLVVLWRGSIFRNLPLVTDAFNLLARSASPKTGKNAGERPRGLTEGATSYHVDRERERHVIIVWKIIIQCVRLNNTICNSEHVNIIYQV